MAAKPGAPMSRMSARTSSLAHSPRPLLPGRQARHRGHRVCVHRADHVLHVHWRGGAQPGHHGRPPRHAGRKLHRRSRRTRKETSISTDRNHRHHEDRRLHHDALQPDSAAGRDPQRHVLVRRTPQSPSSRGSAHTRASATNPTPTCTCMNETYSSATWSCQHHRQRRGGEVNLHLHTPDLRLFPQHERCPAERAVREPTR